MKLIIWHKKCMHSMHRCPGFYDLGVIFYLFPSPCFLRNISIFILHVRVVHSAHLCKFVLTYAHTIRCSLNVFEDILCYTINLTLFYPHTLAGQFIWLIVPKSYTAAISIQDSYLGSKITKTTGEWSCLISFAMALPTCKEAKKSKWKYSAGYRPATFGFQAGRLVRLVIGTVDYLLFKLLQYTKVTGNARGVSKHMVLQRIKLWKFKYKQW